MKEFKNRIENFVDEIKVIREMRKLNFPFQKQRPLLSKIRPEFLLGIIIGAVIVEKTLKVAGLFSKKRKKTNPF